ncbi:LysE family transporter [Guptibacillus algicola]|uniref:LysE family transporter n=1 Tax=Guptibacillus algicola TaxID=225844 RepID=UPI001CD3745F|nr:LysE family transporter [Alkalihalobacillus algicola]MCA0989528.1 LysE family translocator [Alkalihalobacillus algicola]
MSIYISYILLGLSLSAPVGPINAAQVDKGIRYGFLNAWFVGIGAMVADGIFMLLIYVGIGHIVDSPFMKTFLWLFGFFVLSYTGVESIVKSNSIQNDIAGSRNEAKSKSFRTGFFMAISNPLNILFWLGIYGSILAQSSSHLGTYHLLIYSTGIFIGITIWDLIMASVASGARRLVSPQVLRIVSILSGVVLIAFGLYFGKQAMIMLLS